MKMRSLALTLGLALVAACAVEPTRPPRPSRPSEAVTTAQVVTFTATRPRAGQVRREQVTLEVSVYGGRPERLGGEHEVTLLEVDPRGAVLRARLRYGAYRALDSFELADRAFLVARRETTRSDREPGVTEEGEDRGPAPAAEDLAGRLLGEHDDWFPASIIGTRVNQYGERWAVEPDHVEAVALAVGTVLPLPMDAVEPLPGPLPDRTLRFPRASIALRGVREHDGQPCGVFEVELVLCDSIRSSGMRLEGTVRGEVLVALRGARPVASSLRGEVRKCDDGRVFMAWQALRTYRHVD